MAELTGQPCPPQSTGVSMLPTLVGNNGGQKNHEYLYWEHPGGQTRLLIRVGPWKGVVRGWKKTQRELLNSIILTMI